MIIGEIQVSGRKNRKSIKYEIDKNGCWNVTSHCYSHGYPVIRINHKSIIMSRYIYERFVDKIPNDLFILHSCDNPSCINVEHLRVGTCQENIDDKVKRNRQQKVKGEERWNSKMTFISASKIRKDTRSCRLIGLDYGVGRSTIWDIKNNKRWSDI